MSKIKLFTGMVLYLFSCNTLEQKKITETAATERDHNCMQIPSRITNKEDTSTIKFNGNNSIEGMILIPEGSFSMGGDNGQAKMDEYPKHKVHISSFYLDEHEVTNAQFEQFVLATNYITTAEKEPVWEELRKLLPPDALKPPDSLLVAASLVFKASNGPVDLNNYNQWWIWVKGADWRHPEGPTSTIKGKEQYPVVQVSWDDAVAYCKWAGKRLPTEAEWEYAARGGLINNVYAWGNENINTGRVKANSWEGSFPYLNQKKDGFINSAPVKTFEPNGFGLYDMAGNVWEWCNDWYDANYYKIYESSIAMDPKGPSKSFDPQEPYTPKKVVRGGSFLCNEAYCSGYRVACRMRTSPDTGLEHTGFRCARDKN